MGERFPTAPRWTPRISREVARRQPVRSDGGYLRRKDVISGTEGIVDVRNTLDVIEQFADGGAPGGRVRKNVIGRQFEAVSEAVLHLHGQAVVDGAVIAAKKGKTRILVAPILVSSLLMLVTEAQPPIVS